MGGRFPRPCQPPIGGKDGGSGKLLSRPKPRGGWPKACLYKGLPEPRQSDTQAAWKVSRLAHA